MAKIEKLPSGNYRVRVTVGHTAEGKPIRKSFTHYDKTKLRRIAAEYADAHRNAMRRVTVSDAIDGFYAAKSAILSPSTARDYKSMGETLKDKHGEFCRLYVDEVTSRELQTVINGMVEDGKKPKTVKNYHGFLCSVFKYVDFSLPRVNLPQAERPDIRIPEAEEVQKIMQAAAGSRLEVPLGLACMGLRRSEICALTLEDLDKNTIHIHRSAVYGADMEIHVKTTKNYTSDRFVVLPDKLAGKIREQGYIWDSTPAALTNCFSLFLKSHGFPHYRLHDMRHFFASYCHNVLKMSDKQIQAITGHKTSETLRRVYLHSLKQSEVNQNVANNMNTLLM